MVDEKECCGGSACSESSEKVIAEGTPVQDCTKDETCESSSLGCTKDASCADGEIVEPVAVDVPAEAEPVAEVAAS